MRRLVPLILACLAVAACGGGGGGAAHARPRLHGQADHRLFTGGCVPSMCGPHAILLSWSNLHFPGTVGYKLFANGTQVATAARSPHTFTGMACNTKFRLGVQAKNGAGGTSPLYTTVYTTPSCRSSSGGINSDGLHVVGNKLEDGNGNVVVLHGVNVSGPEYACEQGYGIWDGTGQNSAASIAAMKAWHINFVRLNLNEDCWLGINGAPAAFSGTHYIKAIVKYVDALNAAGIYVEIVDMWSAPGTVLAHYQPVAPNEDHSPAMWASMAQTFKNNPDVILSGSGETVVGMKCLMLGCPNRHDRDLDGSYSGTFDRLHTGYFRVAGQDQAVSVFRANGFAGPIAVECATYGNLCQFGTDGTWLGYEPRDSQKPAQLIAETHVYGGNECDTTRCFQTNLQPILDAGIPVIFGETGEFYDGQKGCSRPSARSHMKAFYDWTDAHDVGTAAWTWTAGKGTPGVGLGCLALIENYSRFPIDTAGSDTYAQNVHNHLTSRWPADRAPLPGSP